MTAVLAIDPGGRNTGIVVRSRDDLLAHSLEVRSGPGRMADGPYIRQVLSACIAALKTAGIEPSDKDVYIVGVEEVAYWPDQNPNVRRDQRGLYGTAMVLGGILARWPAAVIVESGRGVAKLHGSYYPKPIRPAGAGKDRLVHVRAAWDHSYAAETVHLQNVRGVPQ